MVASAYHSTARRDFPATMLALAQLVQSMLAGHDERNLDQAQQSPQHFMATCFSFCGSK